MKRIGNLGAAIAMAMVLTAITAVASASASQFRAEEYPMPVVGSQIGTEVAIGTNGAKNPIKTHCTTVTFAGVEATPSSTLTVTPNLKGCKTVGLGSTITPNTCSFVLHSTNEAAPYTGNMDIVCHKEGDTLNVAMAAYPCTAEFPAQSGKGSVEYTNTGVGHSRQITVTFNLTGLKYTYTGTNCPGGAGTFENGTYSGSVAVESSGEDKYPVGVYLANGPVFPSHLFESEIYPMVAQVSQQTSTTIVFPETAVMRCDGGFDMNGKLEGPAGALTQKVVFTGPCLGTFKPNGCRFKLHGSTGESLVNGTLGIACKSGEAMIFERPEGCIYKIPAQNLPNALKFENTGTGKTRAVHVAVETTSLEFSSGCSLKHTGSMFASWDVKGFKYEGAAESGPGEYELIPGSQIGIWAK